MGFIEVKRKVIECVKSERFRHVTREAEKNLLASGMMTKEDLLLILESCRGDGYERKRHHFIDADVHIFRPRGRFDGYYVKFFFVDMETLFISIHTSNPR